jgi:uncharacterized protein
VAELNMLEEQVKFYSEGVLLAGILRRPKSADRLLPLVIHPPGWMGLKSSKLYARYHKEFVREGIAVLCFDYRGFGDSDGVRGWLNPFWQVEDIRNAVTFAQTLDGIDSNRIGIYGSGGTGGGNAIYAAGLDPRITAVCCNVGIADGSKWLHGMRREYEWLEFLERLTKDEQQWVLHGTGEMVDPREDIMIVTPERRRSGIKKDVDTRVPQQMYLRSARYILDYQPIDVVARISPRPLLIICVAKDAVTPAEHSYALYQNAGVPKKIIVQHETTHYAAYEQYFDEIVPEIMGWFSAHLIDQPINIDEEY